MSKKLEKLYIDSAKHWEEQIKIAKEHKHLTLRMCPFCRECEDNCRLCKIDKKICFEPYWTGNSMVHKIVDAKRENLKYALELSKELIKVLEKKGRKI